MFFSSLFFLFLTSFPHAEGATLTEQILKHYGCPESYFTCKALKENFNRDSDKCRVSPRYLASLSQYMDQKEYPYSQIHTSGRVRYFGPVTGKYFYKVTEVRKNSFLIEAKIHFKNLSSFSKTEISIMKRKISRAANIWNENNPFPKRYHFQFSLSEQPQKNIVSAQLIRQNTRGPYFDRWSYNWSVSTISHEFGHILGLFDEYKYLDDNQSSHDDCSSFSIMCSSLYGIPQPHHYQTILQRPFCDL